MFLVICLRTRTCMHFTLFFTSALFATAFLETSNSNLPAHWLEGKNKEKKREKKNQNETNNKTTVDVKRAGVQKSHSNTRIYNNNNNNNNRIYNMSFNFGRQEAFSQEAFHPSRHEGPPNPLAVHGSHFTSRTNPDRSEQELVQRQVARLPCQANEFFAQHLLPYGWHPVLKTLFLGVRSKLGDDDTAVASPMSLLRSHESTVLRRIYSYLSHPYAKHVRLTLPADLVGNYHNNYPIRYVNGRRIKHFQRIGSFGWGFHEGQNERQSLTSTNDAKTGYVSFCKVGNINFPEPSGRNVNMLPFILGDKGSLPDDLQCYYPLIDACPFYREDFGKVAYLTVQESAAVEQGKTQRRPGLHIEAPGVLVPNNADETGDNGDNNEGALCSFKPGVELFRWGTGMFAGPDRYDGGIYTASNVHDTLEVWDALVDCKIPNIVDDHGGCEHLRPLLGPGTKLRAGELVWMTDCTPHEALPQPTTGPRQFFRLVMSDVSHWYAQHSTANPKVPIPDTVTVIGDNKFKRQKTKA